MGSFRLQIFRLICLGSAEVVRRVCRGGAAGSQCYAPLVIEQPLAGDIVGDLMKQIAEVEAKRSRARRKVVARIALRDQAILDRYQGEIFRLPLDRQVMLFGPPGSGKTTTLIKRLAQKRPIFLRYSSRAPSSWPILG